MCDKKSIVYYSAVLRSEAGEQKSELKPVNYGRRVSERKGRWRRNERARDRERERGRDFIVWIDGVGRRSPPPLHY